MPTEAGGEAAIVDTEAAAQAALSSQEPQSDPSADIEARARHLGWAPESEWKGDRKPAKFLNAEEFIDRGEIIAQVKKTFDKRLDAIEKVNGKTLKAIEAQHAKEVAQLRNAQRFAASKGDLTAYDAYSKELDEKLAESPAATITEDPGTAKQAKQDKWIKDNPWYTDDEEMAAYAFGISNRLAEKTPDMDFEENLRQMTEKVRAKFPEKFGGSKPAGHAAVDGGGSLGGAPSRSDPLSKLPAEARAQAKRDMAQFPKIYPNGDAWVKAYNS